MKGITSTLAYVAAFAIVVIWLVSFFIYAVPVIYPVFLEERFWAVWLVSGAFIGPFMVLLIYIGLKVTNSQRLRLKSLLPVFALGFLSLTALAFVFSSLIPSDFEPFRSVTLPALVLALTLFVFSKTKYAKKFKDR